MSAAPVTPGARLTQLAGQAPNEVAVILAMRDGRDVTLTRLQLEQRANQLAHRLVDAGVRQGSMVAVLLPNCAEHVVATLAIYKLGACPVPINARMPAAERDALLAVAQPVAIVGDVPGLETVGRGEMALLDAYSDAPPADAVPQPSKAIASGGATGKPKLIVSPGAFAFPGGAHPFADLLQFQPGDLLYSPGPLYHNQAFFFSQIMLYHGGRILLNDRFDAARTLDLIARHRPQVVSVVPTMMQRILHVPGISACELTGVRILWHMAAACPEWVKRGWIDLLGAERVWELWSATEVTGITVINGTEWLTHPGSVGRGVMTALQIRSEDGSLCPPGTVGEIYSRFGDGSPQHLYKGTAPLPVDADGFSSVGDLGWLDDDGYLYLADRRVDMIVSGGANIYPAEVEAVISAHPSVGDVAVVGTIDSDLGRRVHAIVVPKRGAQSLGRDELDCWCAERLSRYKCPRSYEFLDALPRNEAGKICRSDLRDERDARNSVVAR